MGKHFTQYETGTKVDGSYTAAKQAGELVDLLQSCPLTADQSRVMFEGLTNATPTCSWEWFQGWKQRALDVLAEHTQPGLVWGEDEAGDLGLWAESEIEAV